MDAQLAALELDRLGQDLGDPDPLGRQGAGQVASDAAVAAREVEQAADPGPGPEAPGDDAVEGAEEPQAAREVGDQGLVAVPLVHCEEEGEHLVALVDPAAERRPGRQLGVEHGVDERVRLAVVESVGGHYASSSSASPAPRPVARPAFLA